VEMQGGYPFDDTDNMACAGHFWIYVFIRDQSDQDLWDGTTTKCMVQLCERASGAWTRRIQGYGTVENRSSSRLCRCDSPGFSLRVLRFIVTIRL